MTATATGRWKTKVLMRKAAGAMRAAWKDCEHFTEEVPKTRDGKLMQLTPSVTLDLEAEGHLALKADLGYCGPFVRQGDRELSFIVPHDFVDILNTHDLRVVRNGASTWKPAVAELSADGQHITVSW